MWSNNALQALPENFGYVILTAVASAFMVGYLAERVAFARKALGVKYPTFYSPDNQQFQRAHGNTLENYPQFLMFLFIAGIGFPEASSVLGAICIVSHLSYAHGYYTGDPGKRMWGFYDIGMLGLIGLSVTNALRILEVI